MDKLWAPWRLAYVAAAKPPQPGDPCFICRGQKEEGDRGNLLVQRLSHSVVFLNRFPYNNGHLLIAPRQHKGALAELGSAETLEIQTTLSRFVAILDDLM